MQQSFLGVAFQRKDDNTYEVVYLRPFNFRAEDPVRFQHAVCTRPCWRSTGRVLRKEFPEEFENPVDKSMADRRRWHRLALARQEPSRQELEP
jgi:hypothetical protein